MISNIFLNAVKFISQNLKLVTIGILVFAVLSSKHFIIYNEETLVVMSFLAFVIFSYRMVNESIENSFNERSDAIFHELQNSIILKENLLCELLEEHKKQLHLTQFLKHVREFSLKELAAISGDRQKALQFIFAQQIQQKLKTLANSQNATQENLQIGLQKGFRGSVLEAFNLSKKTLKPRLIQQAFDQLKINTI